MKMKIMVAAIFAATISSNAHAQIKGDLIGKISRNGESLPEFMKTNKCQEGWLSKILLDSNIKLSEYLHLPKDKEVFLHGNSCQDIPPKAVVEMTAKMLQEPQIVMVSKEPDNHESLIDGLRKELAGTKKIAANYFEELGKRPVVEKTVFKPAPALPPPVPINWNPLWAVLLGIIITIGVNYARREINASANFSRPKWWRKGVNKKPPNDTSDNNPPPASTPGKGSNGTLTSSAGSTSAAPRVSKLEKAVPNGTTVKLPTAEKPQISAEVAAELEEIKKGLPSVAEDVELSQFITEGAGPQPPLH